MWMALGPGHMQSRTLRELDTWGAGQQGMHTPRGLSFRGHIHGSQELHGQGSAHAGSHSHRLLGIDLRKLHILEVTC